MIEFGIQVCAILCYTHRLTPPIIHRDIKPANLIRKPSGDYILLDFGNGREFGTRRPLIENQPWKASPWDTIQGIGTAGYSPPEQYRRQSRSDPHRCQPARTTPLSDLYPVGVIMHQMLTGNDPQPRSTENLFHYPSLEEHVYRGLVHPELAALVEELLEWEPDDRPQSAYEVAQRLQILQWELELSNATRFAFSQQQSRLRVPAGNIRLS